MKFLVISDLHGNLDVLDKMEAVFKEADAVLFAGDFAKFGESATGLPALEKLHAMHDSLFAVIGNCDEPSFLAELEKRDISVEKILASHDGLSIIGSGGGSKFSGATPFERTDEELVSDLALVTQQGEGEWNNLIAIMHNPPKDTDCDRVESGAHVGSAGLRKFIEDYKPLAVVTGHIHESAGSSKIGGTTVINPGPLADGNYVWLTVARSGDRWEVKQVDFKNIEKA